MENVELSREGGVSGAEEEKNEGLTHDISGQRFV